MPRPQAKTASCRRLPPPIGAKSAAFGRSCSDSGALSGPFGPQQARFGPPATGPGVESPADDPPWRVSARPFPQPRPASASVNRGRRRNNDMPSARDASRRPARRCADRRRPLDRPCYNREGWRVRAEEAGSAHPADLKIGVQAVFRRRFFAADGGASPLTRAIAPAISVRRRCILEPPPRACTTAKRP